MTAKLRKFRLPRKTVFLIGGVLLLGGATGACALYVGKNRLLGGGEPKVTALACTTVKTFNIKKKDRYWVRKFIKTDPADGLVRVATALRVAEAVYEAEKPDLVQVVVLDRRGPEQRADMRGRAIGADVVYVPHPEDSPDLTGTPVYSAKYIDGQANDSGQFYGEKIQLPPEHIESLVTMLTDHGDCVDPAAPGESEGHGKKEEAHGASAPEADAEGHGTERAEPEKTGHGVEAPAAPESAGHQEPPATQAHEGEAVTPSPVYDEPAVGETPVVEAPAAPDAGREATLPEPAVSNEQTSAAGGKPAAHAAPPVDAVNPEKGAAVKIAVVPEEEEASPQDFYDEPSVSEGH